jgi:hypothetical protein
MLALSFAGLGSRLGASFFQDAHNGFWSSLGFSSSGLLISVTGSRLGFGPSINAGCCGLTRQGVEKAHPTNPQK